LNGGETLSIGSVAVDTPVVLAPMAGVTDVVYRRICREMGAGLVCGEMVSAEGVVYNNARTKALLTTAEDEHPVSIQIFGARPASMAQAAAAAEDAGADIVDVNAGCPTPKIVRNGAGAALLQDLPRLEAILRTVVEHTRRPVTVKVRSGWGASSVNVVEVAKRAEQCGLAAVTVHPRTREQMFRGVADWRIITDVVTGVDIPVIGNGDIRCAQDCTRMINDTGCAAVMIGRAALGNPWIFGRAVSYIQTGMVSPEPGLADRCLVLERHLKSAVKVYGEQHACRIMRKHAAWYLRGVPDAAAARNRVFSATSFAHYQNIIESTLQKSDVDCGVLTSCRQFV